MKPYALNRAIPIGLTVSSALRAKGEAYVFGFAADESDFIDAIAVLEPGDAAVVESDEVPEECAAMLSWMIRSGRTERAVYLVRPDVSYNAVIGQVDGGEFTLALRCEWGTLSSVEPIVTVTLPEKD